MSQATTITTTKGKGGREEPNESKSNKPQKKEQIVGLRLAAFLSYILTQIDFRCVFPPFLLSRKYMHLFLAFLPTTTQLAKKIPWKTPTNSYALRDSYILIINFRELLLTITTSSANTSIVTYWIQSKEKHKNSSKSIKIANNKSSEHATFL